MSYRDANPSDPGYQSLLRGRIVRALENQIPYTPSYLVFLLAVGMLYCENPVVGVANLYSVIAVCVCILGTMCTLFIYGIEKLFSKGGPFRAWLVAILSAMIVAGAALTQQIEDDVPASVRVWMNCRMIPHYPEKAQ